ADEIDIWTGFATRGMGFGATVTAAAVTPHTVTESFEIPNIALGAVTFSNDSCDMSGFADPGETITLSVPLTNPFLTINATGVTASVAGGGTADYGDMAAGASATRDIQFTVPAGTPCGTQLDVVVQINSSLGPVNRTFKLQIGAATATVTASYTSGDINVPIPDFNAGVPGVAEIPVDVTGTGFVGDVNVRLRLDHTFDGDLEISLVAPDGTAIILSNLRGVSGDNFGSGTNDCSGAFAVFDDAAATAVGAGGAPFVGAFRPDSPLAALNGKQMNGTWKLRIRDLGAQDVGTVGCVQLEVSEQLYYCCGIAGTPLMQAAPPAVVTAESAVPANGAPDPDETVTMSFPLKNFGTGLTTNLVATLLSGGGVNSPSGSQSYGVLSPIGPPVAREFTFVPSGNCGDSITATFQLSD
ncbi:MAG: proprotein convertase P-domain-containing protein, partial [Pyrinomonadaceae bacterium]